MMNKKLTVLVIVWAISIIILGAFRASYFVEKAREVFNFEFPSKEAYVSTVVIVQWLRWIYLAALAFITFRLFQHRASWQ